MQRESLIEYPCDFPIKIMGRTEPGFAQAVIELVTQHAPDFDPASVEMRVSRKNRYLSLTCTVRATSHASVYSVGVAGRDEHLPRVDNGIPVVRTDRGGQITYHGPGQVVLYTLIDLQRLGVNVRGFVRSLESAVIDLLERHGIDAHGRADAPGVYVGEAKIAALGLRIRHGRCYHGLALNVAMDLTPFAAIDPCGYPRLPMTSLQALGIDRASDEVADALAETLARRIGLEANT